MTLRSNDLLSADRFPALAQFVAGYLHQDFVVEHQTPAAALRAFLADASGDERRQLREDVERFLSVAALCPWSDVAAAFRRLGGAWSPRTRAELATLIQQALAASPPRS